MKNYESIVTSGDALYQAYLDSCKASRWKAETMQCSMNFLSVISKKQKELRNRTYKTERQREFIANERGKERAITSTRIEDRIVRHSICDNVLVPELTPKLIYDNGASVRDKGVDFTRKEFEKHLHMLFNENKCNDGWILFGDFSKYYDNIPHDQLISDVGNVISDEFSMWLYSVIVDASKVDVSGLTDEEVQGLMNGVFNSIDYRKADFERKGEKYITKSLDIGDQASQISGVFYPTPIDNYLCKLVGISADQVDNYVLRHYDAVKSNKSCPAQFISDPGQFARFKTWIKNILNTGSHMPASSPASTASPVLYRVRKSWADAKSQIGAYNHLEYAKEACKEGYSVYDNNGNAVYSNGHAATPAPQPAPTPKPTQTTYPRKRFVRDIQRAIGAKVDGIPGRETISKTPTLSKSVNRTHPAVIYVQRYLNSIGYNCGDADGITGKKFDAAVKKYQTWMHHPDGEITAGGKTWKHLLGML